MRARIAVIFALAVTFAGCSDVPTSVEGEGLFGTWTLQTVNGSNLPFTILDNDAEKFEVTMGEVVLSRDGTFTDEMGYRHTMAGAEPNPFAETITGRFHQDRELGAIFFEVDGGGTYDMAIGQDGKLRQQIGADFEMVYGR